MTNDALDGSKIEFELAFRLGNLTGADLLRFFASVDCPVQWIRILDRDQKIFGLVVKPISQALAEGFGFDYEIPIICSTYREFQPRVLENRSQIEQAVAEGRLDPDLCIVVSDDPRLSERLSKLDTSVRTHFGFSSEDILGALAGGAPSVWFRRLLQEKLYATDPFDRAGPVHGQEFFGRKKFMSDLLSQLNKGSSVGLYGLRKVGKTSIIQNLSDTANLKGMRWLFAHIDLLSAPPNNRDTTYLYWMLARELNRIVDPSLARQLRLRAVAAPMRLDEITDRPGFEQAVDSDYQRNFSPPSCRVQPRSHSRHRVWRQVALLASE